jgi:hypothetical protein
MQKAKKEPRLSWIILRTVLIFLISYLIFLVFWVQVKDYYGKVVTYTVSELIAVVKDVKFEKMIQEKDIIRIRFSPLRHKAEVGIEIQIKTSTYTFNAPLTFAIMFTLFQFIKRRLRAYFEVLSILFFIHLLYVFSCETLNLTMAFINKGFDPVNKLRIFVYQFLWEFTYNMVIRFEPFLVGVYMYIRFKAGKKT